MAKLPSIRRLMKEDFQDAPSWLDTLMVTLNQFMENVYGALNRSLTFVDNVRAQKKTFRITAGAAASDNTYEFALENSWRPEGLSLWKVTQIGGAYTPITSAVFLSWRIGESNNIVVDAITGLTNGVTYEFTVLVT